MCVGEECKCARGVRDLLCRSFPPGAADKTRVSSRPPSIPPSTLVVFFDLAVVAHLCTSNAPTDDGRGPSVLRAVAITSNRCRPSIRSIDRMKYFLFPIVTVSLSLSAATVGRSFFAPPSSESSFPASRFAVSTFPSVPLSGAPFSSAPPRRSRVRC